MYERYSFIGMAKQDYTKVIDKNMMKNLTSRFCEASDIVAVCVSPDGKCLLAEGQLSGITDDDDWPQQLLSSELVKGLLSEVDEASLEDVSFINLEPDDMPGGLWLSALSIKISGEIIVSWVIAAPGTISEKEFMENVDVFRETSSSIYRGRINLIENEEASIRSIASENEINLAKRTLEATNEIMQLLENDKARPEQIMQRWVELVRSYLNVEYAFIYRINEESNTKDILAEAMAIGTASPYDGKKDIKLSDFENVVSPVIVSSDITKRDDNQGMLSAGVKAALILPLLLGNDGNGNLISAFEYRTGIHRWANHEIKFVTDSAKVIQSILVSRINKNSVTGSFRALEDILNNIGASVFLTNRKSGKVVFCNRMLLSTFGSDWEEGRIQRMVAEGVVPGTTEGSFEIYDTKNNHWYEVTYKNLDWVDGSASMLFSLYDITDRRLHQKKIEQQAFTDFLTGCYNRMCCERDLARVIDETTKNDTNAALVFLDLDDFKHINDGLGHQYGDVLLKVISSAMREVKGVENSCYRMGGDEFIILIPPTAFDRFEEILTDIKDVFSRPYFLKDADYYCTASIGVVTFPEKGDTVQSVVRKADIAMYEAKKSGKNRMARYSADQDSAAGRRLDMEKNMRDAEMSDYDEFLVYYQPIIDVEDGLEECIGAEALVRWDSEKLGFVSPVDFIPLAEYLGLINPIGDHVLKKACRTVKGWNDRGYKYMKVNVNLSVVQLLQNNIVELVEEAINETGINPKSLCLEVTESLAINDMQRMIGILTRIKALGVTIALDDFGTGYSSLNHIREIPFDIIKVDQSFVKDLADDAYSQAFVKMVAELAETIGVKICVEGIESPEQYNVVRNFKIKYIQGYYFDKPLPQKAFEEKYLN